MYHIVRARVDNRAVASNFGALGHSKGTFKSTRSAPHDQARSAQKQQAALVEKEGCTKSAAIAEENKILRSLNVGALGQNPSHFILVRYNPIK